MPTATSVINSATYGTTNYSPAETIKINNPVINNTAYNPINSAMANNFALNKNETIRASSTLNSPAFTTINPTQIAPTAGNYIDTSRTVVTSNNGYTVVNNPAYANINQTIGNLLVSDKGKNTTAASSPNHYMTTNTNTATSPSKTNVTATTTSVNNVPAKVNNYMASLGIN